MTLRPKLTILALAAATTIAAAQTPVAAAPAKPIAFDVVSIRPVHEDTRNFGPVFPPNSDSMTMEYTSLEWAIHLAYHTRRNSQILGLPSWAQESDWNNRYDIHARVAESDVAAWKTYTDAQRWQVVQQLLADRFHLKLHSETVQRPIYQLVIAKGGPKLTPWAGPVQPVTGLTINDNNGYLEIRALGVIIGHHLSLEKLVEFFSDPRFGLGHPTYNHTGLTGNYDFTLKYAPIQASAATPQSGAAPDLAYPDIFTAVQEELGLKLEPTTGPVDILVVDHVERPSEN